MADSAKTRVKRELTALLKKVNSLDDFLSEHPSCPAFMTEEAYALLTDQRRLMVGYKVILEKRLAIW